MDSNISIWNRKSKVIFVLYLLTASWLPESRRMKCAATLRYFFAKLVCKSIHPTANIERGSHFNPYVEVGENSSLGVKCEIDGPAKIGKYVMMGPETVILTRNHRHDNVDIPIILQGYEDYKPVIIEDDVWIGRRVTILPGVTIAKGCIIAAGAVVTKNTSPFSTWGGGTSEENIRERSCK